MNLGLPEGIPPWIVEVVAGQVPECKAEGLRRCGDHHSAAGSGLSELADELERVAREQLPGVLEGAAGDTVAEQIAANIADMRSVAKGLDDLARKAYETAMVLEFQQLLAYGIIITLALQVAASLALFAAGGSVLIYAQRLAAREAAVMGWRGMLLQLAQLLARLVVRFPRLSATVGAAVLGMGIGGGVNLGAQQIQIAWGHRKKTNWKDVGVATAAAAAGAMVGAPVGRILASTVLRRTVNVASTRTARMSGQVLATLAAGAGGGISGGVAGGVTAWAVTGGELRGKDLLSMGITGAGSGLVTSVGSSLNAARAASRSGPVFADSGAGAAPPDIRSVHPHDPVIGDAGNPQQTSAPVGQTGRPGRSVTAAGDGHAVPPRDLSSTDMAHGQEVPPELVGDINQIYDDARAKLDPAKFAEGGPRQAAENYLAEPRGVPRHPGQELPPASGSGSKDSGPQSNSPTGNRGPGAPHTAAPATPHLAPAGASAAPEARPVRVISSTSAGPDAPGPRVSATPDTPPPMISADPTAAPPHSGVADGSGPTALADAPAVTAPDTTPAPDQFTPAAHDGGALAPTADHAVTGAGDPPTGNHPDLTGGVPPQTGDGSHPSGLITYDRGPGEMNCAPEAVARTKDYVDQHDVQWGGDPTAIVDDAAVAGVDAGSYAKAVGGDFKPGGWRTPRELVEEVANNGGHNAFAFQFEHGAHAGTVTQTKPGHVVISERLTRVVTGPDGEIKRVVIDRETYSEGRVLEYDVDSAGNRTDRVSTRENPDALENFYDQLPRTKIVNGVYFTDGLPKFQLHNGETGGMIGIDVPWDNLGNRVDGGTALLDRPANAPPAPETSLSPAEHAAFADLAHAFDLPSAPTPDNAPPVTAAQQPETATAVPNATETVTSSPTVAEPTAHAAPTHTTEPPTAPPRSTPENTPGSTTTPNNGAHQEVTATPQSEPGLPPNTANAHVSAIAPEPGATGLRAPVDPGPQPGVPRTEPPSTAAAATAAAATTATAAAAASETGYATPPIDSPSPAGGLGTRAEVIATHDAPTHAPATGGLTVTTPDAEPDEYQPPASDPEFILPRPDVFPNPGEYGTTFPVEAPREYQRPDGGEFHLPGVPHIEEEEQSDRELAVPRDHTELRPTFPATSPFLDQPADTDRDAAEANPLTEPATNPWSTSPQRLSATPPTPLPAPPPAGSPTASPDTVLRPNQFPTRFDRNAPGAPTDPSRWVPFDPSSLDYLPPLSGLPDHASRPGAFLAVPPSEPVEAVSFPWVQAKAGGNRPHKGRKNRGGPKSNPTTPTPPPAGAPQPAPQPGSETTPAPAPVAEPPAEPQRIIQEPAAEEPGTAVQQPDEATQPDQATQPEQAPATNSASKFLDSPAAHTARTPPNKNLRKRFFTSVPIAIATTSIIQLNSSFLLDHGATNSDLSVAQLTANAAGFVGSLSAVKIGNSFRHRESLKFMSSLGLTASAAAGGWIMFGLDGVIYAAIGVAGILVFIDNVNGNIGTLYNMWLAKSEEEKVVARKYSLIERSSGSAVGKGLGPAASAIGDWFMNGLLAAAHGVNLFVLSKLPSPTRAEFKKEAAEFKKMVAEQKAKGEKATKKPGTVAGIRRMLADDWMKWYLAISPPAVFAVGLGQSHVAIMANEQNYGSAAKGVVFASLGLGYAAAYPFTEKLRRHISFERAYPWSLYTLAAQMGAYALIPGQPLAIGALSFTAGVASYINNLQFAGKRDEVAGDALAGTTSAINTTNLIWGMAAGAALSPMFALGSTTVGLLDAALLTASGIGASVIGIATRRRNAKLPQTGDGSSPHPDSVAADPAAVTNTTKQLARAFQKLRGDTEYTDPKSNAKGSWKPLEDIIGTKIRPHALTGDAAVADIVGKVRTRQDEVALAVVITQKGTQVEGAIITDIEGVPLRLGKLLDDPDTVSFAYFTDNNKGGLSPARPPKRGGIFRRRHKEDPESELQGSSPETTPPPPEPGPQQAPTPTEPGPEAPSPRTPGAAQPSSPDKPFNSRSALPTHPAETPTTHQPKPWKTPHQTNLTNTIPEVPLAGNETSGHGARIGPDPAESAPPTATRGERPIDTGNLDTAPERSPARSTRIPHIEEALDLPLAKTAGPHHGPRMPTATSPTRH